MGVDFNIPPSSPPQHDTYDRPGASCSYLIQLRAQASSQKSTRTGQQGCGGWAGRVVLRIVFFFRQQNSLFRQFHRFFAKWGLFFANFFDHARVSVSPSGVSFPPSGVSFSTGYLTLRYRVQHQALLHLAWAPRLHRHWRRDSSSWQRAALVICAATITGIASSSAGGAAPLPQPAATPPPAEPAL